METVSSFTSRGYDFVIVGGGTAGLVLAVRLSENESITVSVIEAERDCSDDPKILTPGFCGTLSGDPDYDWKFMTTPQESLNGRRIAWPRGRCLGGSSAINFMQMTYPSAAEGDTWAYLGNPSWSWKDLEPYYRRSQTLNRPTDDVSALLGTSHYNPSKDGKGGPIQVSFYKSCSELQRAWLETFEVRGHRMDGDPLSGHAIGGFTNPASVDPTSMSRSYSTNAYYQPNSARRNLFVLTDAHVQKIHFDQTQVTTGKVTASRVSFIHGGKEHMVQARREVILCAGAIQSPQLLELSGIGSRAILQAHNIDNVIENPNVGENLQDHALVGISYEVRDSHTSLDALRDPVLLNEALTAYATEKKGPFAEGVQASAFVPLTPSLSGRDDGDLAEDISIENSNESIVLPYQVSPHSKADHV